MAHVENLGFLGARSGRAQLYGGIGYGVVGDESSARCICVIFGSSIQACNAKTWQAVNGVKPASISLTLDGLPLKVDDAGRALLPARSLKSLHILTAELWFPPGVTAYRDTSYGGDYGSDVSTELTAVPVRLAPGRSLPEPDWDDVSAVRMSSGLL